jgi:hypothetical protein
VKVWPSAGLRANQMIKRCYLFKCRPREYPLDIADSHPSALLASSKADIVSLRSPPHASMAASMSA